MGKGRDSFLDKQVVQIYNLLEKSKLQEEGPHVVFTNKQLKKLIIPLIIEQFLAVLVGTMDVMMVSQVGEHATSGVSLIDQMTFLFVQAFGALSTGGSIIASNYIGQKDEKMASKSADQLLVSTTLIGAIIMLFCFIGREFLVDTIYGSIDTNVRDSALIYFLITCISYPFLAAYSGASALCRAMGDSRITMRVSIIVNLVNVSGNALLIMVFKMGTAGVAIPTLVSRILGAVLMYFVVRDKRRPIHTSLSRKFRFDFGMIRRILKVGIPSGIDGSVFQIGKLLVASLISTLGTVSIAANAVTNTLSSIVIIPGSAMGLALITVVGQCMGAGEADQAVMYTKKIMKYVHLAVFAMGGLMALGSPLILRLYNLSDETYEIAKFLIISYSAIAFIDWPESFALPNALRAGGDATYVMTYSMISMWVFRIGCSYLFVLGFKLGVYGVWAAMYVDWVFRAIMYVTRFRSRKWMKLLVKKESQDREVSQNNA